MIDVGRLCIKIAGRDAGKKCVVIDSVNANTVLIDGETRRRKCSTAHIEPLKETVDIKKGASHEEVAKLFKEKLGIELKESKKVKPVPKSKQ